MKTIPYARIVLCFICLPLINSLSYSRDESLPARKVSIKKHLIGIAITGDKSGLIHTPGVTESSEREIINFQAGEEISISLQGRSPEEHFKLSDVEDFCRQGSDLVQSIGISYCSDQDELNKTLHCLSNQRALKTVSIYLPAFRIRSIRPLAALDSLTTFSLMNCDTHLDVSFGEVFKNSRLKHLYMKRVYTENFFADLNKVKSLQDIHIEQCALGEKDFSIVGNNESIKHLEITEMFPKDDFKGKSIKNLGNLKNLEELSIFVRSSGKIEDYSFLDKMNNLKKLTLIDTSIKPYNLFHIAQLTNLEELDLSYQNYLSKAHADFKELKELKKLKKIVLYDTEISSQALNNLREIASLKEILLKRPEPH